MLNSTMYRVSVRAVRTAAAVRRGPCVSFASTPFESTSSPASGNDDKEETTLKPKAKYVKVADIAKALAGEHDITNAQSTKIVKQVFDHIGAVSLTFCLLQWMATLAFVPLHHYHSHHQLLTNFIPNIANSAHYTRTHTFHIICAGLGGEKERPDYRIWNLSVLRIQTAQGPQSKHRRELDDSGQTASQVCRADAPERMGRNGYRPTRREENYHQKNVGKKEGRRRRGGH